MGKPYLEPHAPTLECEGCRRLFGDEADDWADGQMNEAEDDAGRVRAAFLLWASFLREVGHWWGDERDAGH